MEKMTSISVRGGKAAFKEKPLMKELPPPPVEVVNTTLENNIFLYLALT
jgi:hypothetical protein